MDPEEALTEDKLKTAFRMFDESGEGLISADEIIKYLGCPKRLYKKL